MFLIFDVTILIKLSVLREVKRRNAIKSKGVRFDFYAKSMSKAFFIIDRNIVYLKLV
jgi:hypothetical protein